MECRFKRAVLSALFLAILVSMAYADCRSERSGYIKEKHRCISLFRKAYAPEKQPKEGVLVLNDEDVSACFDKLNYDYEAFGENGTCNSFVPKELENNFQKFTKACLHRFDRNGCDALFEKSKVDNIRNADGATLLMIAAREGDVNAIDYLVSKGANVNKVDHSGKNALMYALSHDGYPVDEAEEIAVVKKILDLGVHPQELDLDGNSSLMYAVKNNSSMSVVQMLIDKGANIMISYRDSNGYDATAMTNAIAYDRVEILKKFIANGAKPDKHSGNVPLWTFVWGVKGKDQAKGDTIAVILLNAGLDPNGYIDLNRGQSAFADAIRAPAPDFVINAFLKARVDVNNLVWNGEHWDPMRRAIYDKNNNLIQGLLQAGYDTRLLIKLDDGTEISAFEFAIASKNLEAAKMLLKKRPDVNRLIQKGDGSTTMPLCLAVGTDNVEFVKLLVSAKANVQSCGNDADAPLVYAVNNENEEMVRVLVSAKADVNVKYGESNESTPLDLAIYKKNVRIIELLKKAGARIPFRGNFVDFCLNPNLTEKDVLDALKDGADVNEVDEEQGWTPLHSVAQNGKNPKVMSILIKKGAFVNAMTKSGFTPFLSAARHNPNPEFLKMLIAAGADVEAKSSDGWQALQIAVANNSPAVVALLLKTSLAEDLSESSKNVLVRTAVYNNPNPKVLITLFKAGFRAEPENSWWDKPLHAALENKKSVEIIKVLLQGHALVDDKAMRLARDLPMDSQEEKKYRNQVIDLLTKAKKKQK